MQRPEQIGREHEAALEHGDDEEVVEAGLRDAPRHGVDALGDRCRRKHHLDESQAWHWVSAMRHLSHEDRADLRFPMGKPAARNIALATRSNSPHQSATILND